jgi:RNA polymerase sigma-70 factor (ECF subfamily)
LDFLEESGPDLYALLVRLTLREDTAEDLMQELFIKLNNSNALNRAKNRYAYARRCAINLAFDWRKKTRVNVVQLNAAHEPVSQKASPLDSLVHSEELESILDATARLSGLSRECFVMRYVQQSSFEDIALQLGKSQHQVRALCSKGMRQLRKMFQTGRSNFSQKGGER